MALKGTLKDFGIADIFQLIGQQQKTGILHVTDREQEVHVAFKDGNVVRTDSATRRKKDLIGDMLARAGLISEKQLAEALDEQKRTLRRLGDILIGSGIIERDVLRQMAHLQTTETLYRLFAWKSGRYEFEATEVEYDADAVTPIRSESVLMEAFRRIDEWPLIRKRIPNNAVTFEQLRPLPPAPAGGRDPIDAAFGRAFGESPEAEEEGEGGDAEIGENERRVYRLAEPGRDVQFIVDHSRLGEFEACKALFNLVQAGYLKPLASDQAAVLDAGADHTTWSGRLAAWAAQLAVATLTAGVVALAAAGLRPGTPEPVSPQALERHLDRAQRARIEAALDSFVRLEGHLPESLLELVEAGMLSEADLRYPWGKSYHYRRTEPDRYLLLPPFP